MTRGPGDQPAVSDPPSADSSLEALERELAMLLRRARAYSAQIAREVHPDLEAGAYALLVHLADAGGERLTDLAAAFGVGKPTISRQVSALERLQLLERRPALDDARAQLLQLTPEGRQRLAAARSARREKFRTLLSRWPAEDVSALARLLNGFNRLGEPD